MLNYQKMISEMVTIFEERRCQVEQRRGARHGELEKKMTFFLSL